jgi:pimeloyl-ACP methyl ester carboxylesterase
MATFALVHGAWHDARCWESLTPLLHRARHDVVAMDLPCDDGEAGFDMYADVVCDAIEGRDEVVLVGHSLAGLTVPLVAARRPLRHLVYLCAAVPDIGRTFAQQLADEPGMFNAACYAGLSELDAQGRRKWVDFELARTLLYGDCEQAVADVALSRLRPQARFPYSVPFALSAFPAVPTTSVICTEDQAIGPDWSRSVARDRLHAEVVELPGSHSPFLSRPEALADLLVRLAEDQAFARS